MDSEPKPRLSQGSIPRSERGEKPSRFDAFVDLFQAAAGPSSPLELQLLGKMLLHAALVGAAAGLVGSLFFVSLEAAERLVLESVAGYSPLRAAGEAIAGAEAEHRFHPLVLVVLPAIGALVGGVLAHRFAPEAMGGGADAVIEAFHHEGGHVRRRVPVIKILASVFTLGSGGSGGREGPTMHVGGALGSIIGGALKVSERERRILLIAGAAAGMAAVFRTPLGAALLMVEVLHTDDFESDALVPSVLASVVSYSVFISFFGESDLFAHAPHYPFIPAHLPLYALMAIIVSVIAWAFSSLLHGVQKVSNRSHLPRWARPAVGGLALGLMVTPIVYVVGMKSGQPGMGLGMLGGGYGIAQVAITGDQLLPKGWLGVEILVVIGVVKMIASSLTIGSGGSAGDFGPSLVLGGIFGGAFGRAAQMLLDDPRIDPGAFALVGMATFYGGLAHVPIAALVMTCELAGSYDLLVPLMLTEGIAFVLLRRAALYTSQVPSKRESPAHKDDLILDVLRDITVGEVVVKDREYHTFTPSTPGAEVLRRVAESEWQDAFPVFDADENLVGIVSSEILRTYAAEPDIAKMMVAADFMTNPVVVRDADDLHSALVLLLDEGVRELVVTNEAGKIVGFIDESEITSTYHGRTSQRRATRYPR